MLKKVSPTVSRVARGESGIPVEPINLPGVNSRARTKSDELYVVRGGENRLVGEAAQRAVWREGDVPIKASRPHEALIFRFELSTLPRSFPRDEGGTGIRKLGGHEPARLCTGSYARRATLRLAASLCRGPLPDPLRTPEDPYSRQESCHCVASKGGHCGIALSAGSAPPRCRNSRDGRPVSSTASCAT
jgi:hypothetical protein